jgi:site-specific DNA recombinase
MKRAQRQAEGPKQVGIWIRVSTEDQVKGESPEHHEKRARLYAESRDWNVVTVYHLDAISGKTVMGLPETQRMLADVRSGRITGLIFSKLARLARNNRELLEFSDIFREHDAGLISLAESIDTSTPAGRLFYAMIAALAEWEREEIVARVAASVPIRAKLGKPLGGAAPFGYQWQNRELVPDPKEAPIRARLYELFAEHRRLKTVARLLNEAGHRTRGNAPFTNTTVERLIRDTTAKGERRANYTKSLGDGKKWILKPESEWVVTPIPAIVPEELWQRCNAILDDRRESARPPSRKAVHLFTGLLFCKCGTKMYVPSDSRSYACRKCKLRIPTDDIEAVFKEQLAAFFLTPAIQEHLDQADEGLAAKQRLLETLETEHGRIGREMEQTHRLYLDGKISGDGFDRTYRPLEARFQQLEAEVPTLQGEIDFARIRRLSSEEVVSEAEDLLKRWDKFTHEEKRSIVETAVERIDFDGAEVAIALAWFPRSALNPPTKGTRSHGFIAATRTNRVGKTAVRAARPIVTRPSSSGWRSTSRTRRSNSGISSRNSTPLCASEISPGRGMAPPPTRATFETVWCGARNGRSDSKPAPAGSVPATEWIAVHSSASSNVSGGRIVPTRRASMVLPAPGGPMSNRLCAPAAATSSARRASNCPRTSARSPSLTGTGGAGVATDRGASCGWFSALTASGSDRAVHTSRPLTTHASAAFWGGSSIRFMPSRRAATAIGSTPRTPLIAPSSDNSPTTTVSSTAARVTCPEVASRPSAIGRSNDDPALRTSAGARFTVMRCGGNSKPEFLIAERTRSRLSRTVASGRPTIEKWGSPNETSTSMWTG